MLFLGSFLFRLVGYDIDVVPMPVPTVNTFFANCKTLCPFLLPLKWVPSLGEIYTTHGHLEKAGTPTVHKRVPHRGRGGSYFFFLQ